MKKLPKISTVRNKCDNLLTPIIKKLHPHCLLCGAETQVAHHHVHKSKSTRLRYDIQNLIPLCGRCHVRLHANESYWGSIVTDKIGAERFQYLIKGTHETVKADVHYYIYHLARLQMIYESADYESAN